MGPPTLSYGLNLSGKKQPGKPSATIKAFTAAGQKRKKTIFDSDSDSGGNDDAKNCNNGGNNNDGKIETIETLGGLGGIAPPPSIEPAAKRHASEERRTPPALGSSKTKTAKTDRERINLSSFHASNKHAQAAAAIDPTIYDYDAIYDSLHPPKRNSSDATNNENGGGGPKYIGALLRSAEVRKRDQLRARDKLLAREREAEGDEFADKEKFVTAAYKAQQEEVRRIEQDEAAREKEEEEKRKKGLGMNRFYKDMLERDGRRHEEAMKAAEEAVARKKAGLFPGEGEQGGDEEEKDGKDKSAAQIAAELNARGARIAVNDEGEVVDKRQLLTAGLNVSAKAKTAKTPTAAGTSRDRAHFDRDHGRAGTGAFAARSMQRARQTEMIAAQLEQKQQQEREEEEARLKVVAEKNKSKKTEADVMSAKERYLARKREREKDKEKGK